MIKCKRRYIHGKRRKRSPLHVDLTKKEGLGPREKVYKQTEKDIQ